MLGPLLPQTLDTVAVVVMVIVSIRVCFKNRKQVIKGRSTSPRDEDTGRVNEDRQKGFIRKTRHNLGTRAK